MSENLPTEPAPEPIRPQPVPMQIDVDALSTSIGNLVRLQVRTHSGQHIFFLAPDVAKAVAGVIAASAMQASSGLILPDGVIPPARDPEEN